MQPKISSYSSAFSLYVDFEQIIGVEDIHASRHPGEVVGASRYGELPYQYTFGIPHADAVAVAAGLIGRRLVRDA